MYILPTLDGCGKAGENKIIQKQKPSRSRSVDVDWSSPNAGKNRANVTNSKKRRRNVTQIDSYSAFACVSNPPTHMQDGFLDDIPTSSILLSSTYHWMCWQNTPFFLACSLHGMCRYCSNAERPRIKNPACYDVFACTTI